MNSLVLFVFAAWQFTERQAVPAWLAYTLAFVWVAWIGLARMYMGLHTPIDVLGGIAGGTVLLCLWARFFGVPPPFAFPVYTGAQVLHSFVAFAFLLAKNHCGTAVKLRLRVVARANGQTSGS